MKHTRLLTLAFIPFLLAGCGGDKFPGLTTGEKVILSNDNLNRYLKVTSKTSLKKDKEGSIVAINYSLNTSGYTELTYFVETLTINITFKYISDTGDLTDGLIAVSANPGKDGSSDKKSGSYACNYRSVSDIGIGSYIVVGFVVKK